MIATIEDIPMDETIHDIDHRRHSALNSKILFIISTIEWLAITEDIQ